jgi:hypothetical protein
VAGATFAQALLTNSTGRALRVLFGDEHRVPKVDHHVRDVNYLLPAVRHDVTNGLVQLLYYFSGIGRYGPRHVSSSRTLYRKKPGE